VFVNIGRVFEERKEYEKALDYYKKALDGFKEFNNRRGRASALVYRAGTYFDQGAYSLCLADLEESLALARESNYQAFIIDGLILKGKVFQAQKQYDEAIDNLMQAAEMAKKIGSKTNLSITYQLLADLYFHKGDFKNAYDFQGLHAVYHDSSFNAEKSKQIQEMQFRFETENKEKEIEILKRDHM